MKNKLSRIVFTAFIAALFSIISCDGGHNPSALVGRWICVSGEGKDTFVMELLSDGSGIFTEAKGFAITWKTENGRFYMITSGTAQSESYKLQGSLLTFTDDNGEVQEWVKCKKDCKEAATEYAKSKADSPIIDDLQIKIDKNSIYVGKKKVASTADVAEQDSMLVEKLAKELENKKESMVQIYTEPDVKYGVLGRATATSYFLGFKDIVVTTKANGKDYNIPLPIKKDTKKDNNYNEDNALNLIVNLAETNIEIWARGGSLPKIFYKECKDSMGNIELCTLLRLSENDLGTLQMSVYSKTDSAYLNNENEFITNLSDVKSGATVATLAENSSRRLACGQSAPGVEDICDTDGKPAISLKPRSAYDELARILMLIHNRFSEAPDANDILVISDGDIEVSKIILLLHRARAAGFTNIELGSRAE